jgi:xanthine dehydrogenase YagT iron-sulfur-binding subunit
MFAMPNTSVPAPTRRGLLVGGVGSAATVPLVARASDASQASSARGVRGAIAFQLKVNGQQRQLIADVRTSLLDALREHLGLTGAKKGCDHGQCGACTVLINGRRELSCLTLAIAAQNRSVTTIEGLADGDRLHPMQAAFIRHDAFQCGYCTPGQILSAVACVNEGKATSPEVIAESMSGNLCRCAAYPKIVAAISEAAGEMERG